MGTRLELQTLLETLVGSQNVYFQPPPTLSMNYPCIVYKINNEKVSFADNKPYKHTKRYLITVIDKNPDSILPDKISKLSMSSFDRHMTVNGLNHYIYNLYF